MTWRNDLLIPMFYRTERWRLDRVYPWLMAHHHPEYVRRLMEWLDAENGVIGIGGGWRDDGTQPNLPGFAPEGKSFHQNQPFNDGFIGAAAVDLVKYRPGQIHGTVAWSDVLPQGSGASIAWGLHCNVSSESWHMQPIEIDGWSSWMNNGRPSPRPNYPLPLNPEPTPTPTPTPTGVVLKYLVVANDSWWRIAEKVFEDGDGSRWPSIQVVNPNVVTLQPGMYINIPGRVAV